MTDVSPAAPVVANGHDAALLDKAKRLIETTTWSQTKIAIQLDISQTTLSSWKLRWGWVRPKGAPLAPMFDAAVRARRAAEPMEARTDLRRRRLIDRLYRACTRQVFQIEMRLKDKATDDKDARALGLLAKTVETLTTLERDPGKTKTPEPVDRDAIESDLVRRINAWAEGGEETQ